MIVSYTLAFPFLVYDSKLAHLGHFVTVAVTTACRWREVFGTHASMAARAFGAGWLDLRLEIENYSV
jgi:hypothetical protein